MKRPAPTKTELVMVVCDLQMDAMFTAQHPELARPADVIDGDVNAHRALAADLGAIVLHLLDGEAGAYVALKHGLTTGGVE